MLLNNLMHFYTKNFFLLIILLLLLTGFFNSKYIYPLVLFILILNFFILIITYFYHKRLLSIIGKDIDKMILITRLNNINKFNDVLSLIAVHPNEIPEGIITQDPYAKKVFEALQKKKFLHCVTTTFHTKNYYRYDWLNIDKSKNTTLLNNLKIGDILLYHNKQSLIGKLIRFITRLYWEHTAIYIGNGLVFEATLNGVVKTPISNWLNNENIHIGVIRSLSMNRSEKEIVSFCEEKLGAKYNYIGVLKIFWIIITNKSCHGLMTPIIFVINLILLLASFLYCYNSDNIRLQLLIILLTTPYLFSTIYHWIAFNNENIKKI